jgi:uridine kinase
MDQRELVLRQLAECILALHHSHPVRVAIDGVDAAGKTTIANALSPIIACSGRHVIRASIDGFHRPREDPG